MTNTGCTHELKFIRKSDWFPKYKGVDFRYIWCHKCGEEIGTEERRAEARYTVKTASELKAGEEIFIGGRICILEDDAVTSENTTLVSLHTTIGEFTVSGLRYMKVFS